MACCNMKGLLSYLLLWSLNKKSLSGAELAKEMEKRKGFKPSPGTIYPALKELLKKGLVSRDPKKNYSLTKKGEKELKEACSCFCRAFYDMQEMANCCTGRG